MKFTTRDRDNDMYSNGNCALNTGGWWYLNRQYSNIHMDLNGQTVYLTFVELKNRSRSCDIN